MEALRFIAVALLLVLGSVGQAGAPSLPAAHIVSPPIADPFAVERAIPGRRRGQTLEESPRHLPPRLQARTLADNYDEYLTKDLGTIQQHLAANEANSGAALIAASVASGIPPGDYHICIQKYQQASGTFTPLIHSLCTWWAQTDRLTSPGGQSSMLCRQVRDQPARHGGEPLKRGVDCMFCCVSDMERMGGQLVNKRQCFRFYGDEFLDSPLLAEFARVCPGNQPRPRCRCPSRANSLTVRCLPWFGWAYRWQSTASA
jgi:hypothetical protein